MGLLGIVVGVPRGVVRRDHTRVWDVTIIRTEP